MPELEFETRRGKEVEELTCAEASGWKEWGTFMRRINESREKHLIGHLSLVEDLGC